VAPDFRELYKLSRKFIITLECVRSRNSTERLEKDLPESGEETES
jgi:hypothetical protein